jgi:hypothetical protein
MKGLMVAINDGVRFLLEMCALVAVGYWGWRTGSSLPTRLLLSVGSVLVLATVWAVFRADENALVSVPTVVRIGIEVGVFAAATGALWATGHLCLAVGFAVLAAVNEVLNYAL